MTKSISINVKPVTPVVIRKSIPMNGVFTNQKTVVKKFKSSVHKIANKNRKNRHKKGRKFQQIKSDLLKTWKDFCNSTTFAGVRLIGGKASGKGIIRILFICVWLSQLALCAWLSCKIFIRYLQYDVATSTTFEVAQELPFPAITICNQNMFRKSVIGGNAVMMYAISAFYANNADEVGEFVKKVITLVVFILL